MSDNSPNDWIDRRPQQQQLDVGEESLRTQNRESKIAEGSAQFVDDRDDPPPETEQARASCLICGTALTSWLLGEPEYCSAECYRESVGSGF